MSLKANLDVVINRADLAQFQLTKKLSNRTKISPIYKTLWQWYRFESGRSSPRATPTEKENGRQIVTCKIGARD